MGVFVKDSIKKIQKIVKKLDLKAVQLYGYSQKEIAQLKKHSLKLARSGK